MWINAWENRLRKNSGRKKITQKAVESFLSWLNLDGSQIQKPRRSIQAKIPQLKPTPYRNANPILSYTRVPVLSMSPLSTGATAIASSVRRSCQVQPVTAPGPPPSLAPLSSSRSTSDHHRRSIASAVSLKGWGRGRGKRGGDRSTARKLNKKLHHDIQTTSSLRVEYKYKYERDIQHSARARARARARGERRERSRDALGDAEGEGDRRTLLAKTI